MAARTPTPRSLFGEILDWLLVPLLLLWPLSVLLFWLAAQSIANRPFDRELADAARIIARRVSVAPGPAPQGLRLEINDAALLVLRGDPPDALYYQVLGPRGEWVAGERELRVPEEARAADGEVRFRDDEFDGRSVRVAYLWPAVGAARGGVQALIQVAETLNKRSQLATEITRGVLLSQFAILPLAVLLVWLALMRGLRPLDELQRRIRQRASDDLSPIDDHQAPEEVSPLVAAINDVLGRLDASLAAQKHFLADAAHQLKTPLAGLRTQAELVQRELDAGDTKAVRRSLLQIARSSQRAAHMVNQLLSMARADDRGEPRRMQAFNLAALATETVHDFVPRALAKGLDLGYEGPDARDATAPRLDGEPVLVRELIRNLVDNAVQYTPEGGTVTVRVLAAAEGLAAAVQVEDNGPGIAEAERDLVFQPFYRGLGTEVDGSGLGLAIVREIAERHGGGVAIEPGLAQGTRITVRFALAKGPS